VDRDAARALLTAVADGGLDVDTALGRLAAGELGPGVDGYADLGFARLDTARARRTGDPEVVYGEGKHPDQVVEILQTLRRAHPDRPVLVTRADEEVRATVRAGLGAEDLQVDPLARCVAVGPMPRPTGVVAVLSAGTADAPVAAEAAFVAAVHGAGVRQVPDVGVAGLHRLLAARPVLEEADCLVVVAGMDGALPSVVGGLVGVPLVAVPTSVGYGATFGGLSALLTMLTSCAPGVAVMGIDNGFGAGVFAARVARRSRPAPPAAASPAAGDVPP